MQLCTRNPPPSRGKPNGNRGGSYERPLRGRHPALVRAPERVVAPSRRRERVNDLVDWENVIDEVESVGSEQLHAVRSLLRQALIHI